MRYREPDIPIIILLSLSILIFFYTSFAAIVRAFLFVDVKMLIIFYSLHTPQIAEAEKKKKKFKRRKGTRRKLSDKKIQFYDGRKMSD